jgi:dienelactone hydrolase
MSMRRGAMTFSWIALCAATLLTWPAGAVLAGQVAVQTTPGAPTVEPPITFEASVPPQPGEDVAQACTYELTLLSGARPVRGVWTIFERSRETLAYYQDGEVRAFARRHDLALLFPRQCPSKSDTGGDINVDPTKGLGRSLFAALNDLARRSAHAELASARLILLGFSGTGSLVGRLAAFAPERIIAVVSGNPGHAEPLGVDTIALSPEAAAIPHFILVGSADAVAGTERPYAYFRRHADRGAWWTFVVQNRVPHCCIMNAKALILAWLEAVVEPPPSSGERYGFMHTTRSVDADCPGQSAPVRTSWCRAGKDAWGGTNWSVDRAKVERRPRPPQGMVPAGWLPSEAFAKQWLAFVTEREHPVTLPP